MNENYIFFPFSETGKSFTPSWLKGQLKNSLCLPQLTTPNSVWFADAAFYRDELRGGWHIVPKNIRFVAIKGNVAGQWAWGGGGTGNDEKSCRYRAQQFQAGLQDKGTGSVKRSSCKDEWCIIDLQDLDEHPETDRGLASNTRFARVSAKPADAEIVCAWENIMRNEGKGLLGVKSKTSDETRFILVPSANGSFKINLKDARIAWKHELQRREAERVIKERKRFPIKPDVLDEFEEGISPDETGADILLPKELR